MATMIFIPGFTERVLVMAMIGAACAGCNSGYGTLAPVSGHVTIDDTPVKVGRVVFYPTQGRSATGAIQSDGSYVLTTYESADGASLGSHKVTIQATELVGPPPPPPDEEYKVREKLPVVKWLVPQKYAEPTSSDLVAEVKDQKNQINFALKTK
jgi:hypothetical protein